MANEKIFNIGRNEDNDIILNDITVSGQHAKLIVNSLGHLFLEDSNSLNGTWIFNGHDYEAIMRRARVKNKDRIRFGEGELMVEDLVEYIRPAYPEFFACFLPLNKDSRPVSNQRVLVRCRCGFPKPPDQPCPRCNYLGYTR